MRNADLQSIVDRFLTAAPAIIISARAHTFNGSCMICKAAKGQQHAESCALWGLVAGRIDYRRLSDSRPSGPEPTFIETMVTMEAGTDLFAAAPTLLYADGGQR